MMKKTLFYTSMFLMLFTATSLQAQEVKVYAALGAGAYSLKYAENGPSGSLSAKKSALPAGILRVGFDYDYFGGELRFGVMQGANTSLPTGTLGSATPFNLNLQASPFFSYLGKIQYPVTRSFNVYALLGGTAAKFSINPSGTGVLLNSSATKTGFTYGIGAEYKPRPQFAIGLEWIQYWTDVTMAVSGGAQSKVSFGGLGISFRRSFE